MMHRRAFLAALGAAGALAATAGLPAGARASVGGSPRLVVVVLRGGLDGLHALVPHGDPAYATARQGLALPREALHDLDGTFGLHPALAPLAPWYAEGCLLPVHAVGVPYRDRSHFDAQDVLEGGGDRPGILRDGWLGRGLAHRPGSVGLALGRTVPHVLRGPVGARALDPGRRRGAHADLLDALAGLYGADPAFAGALRSGRASLALLPDEAVRGEGGALGPRGAHVLGAVDRQVEGPVAVTVEAGGWDTHARQGTTDGVLARRLGALAEGLVALRQGLGPAWDRTAVVVVTEFGRTIRPNGTGGTDHGVGGAAFLAGGAVAGGRGLADWPGLGEGQRLDGRDLRPTLDVRDLLAGVLADHLGLGRPGLQAAFPGRGGSRRVRGLIRGA